MTQLGWVLDHEDRITALTGPWAEFARANGAPELDEERLVQQSLWDFVQGEETRSLYEQLFERVRSSGLGLELPYRCDAPDQRRDMLLRIDPLARQGLHLRSTLVQETARSVLPGLESDRARKDDEVQICAVCRKVELPDGSWEEAEVAARDHGLLTGPLAPSLEERVCSDCADSQNGAGYVITQLGPAPRSGRETQPLLVSLHDQGQPNDLLRLHASALEEQLAGDSLLLCSLLHPAESGWDEARLDRILDEVLERYAISPGQVHLTGVGVGAVAAWDWARRRRFRSLVPVSGRAGTLEGLEGTRVWSWFAADEEPDDLAVQTSEGADVRVTLTEPEQGPVWSRAYGDPALWAWMLAA